MSKHIPILFSTAMVQAIIKERKSQTRRVIKGIALDWLNDFTPEFVADPENSLCPYGKPGDVLWVRETFQKRSHDAIKVGFDKYYYKQGWKGCTDAGWKPSIYMPKEACRIWLEVVSVRIERIQDISETDAIAEGVGCGFQLNAGYPDYQHVSNGVCEVTQDTAAMSFCSLWQTIHEGKDSDWNNNPWVWVVEFKQIEKPENFV